MELGARIAVSQQPMQWQVEENLAEIESSLEAASAHGANLVLFPEMTIIGLHTKLRELLDRAELAEALNKVGDVCRAHKVGAAVGAPVWFDGERPRNSVVVFSTEGERIGTSCKLRLMPPGEPIVFEEGIERPVFEWNGVTLAVVICREILDRKELADELAERARIILWPGTMARGPIDPNNPEDYAVHATQLAKKQNAWVIHSNWARHVDAPELPLTGKSMVITPDGSVTLEAPAQAPGLLLAWESSLERAWVPSGPDPNPHPSAA